VYLPFNVSLKESRKENYFPLWVLLFPSGSVEVQNSLKGTVSDTKSK
jgi:hypothetical protein